MTQIAYIEKSFHAATLKTIETANEIIDDYIRQGFILTLRQLFYQFVGRALIANSEREYKKLGNIIKDARRTGLTDWEAIEDRTRNVVWWPSWSGPRELLESAAGQFCRDKWATQSYRPEIWIEKEALVGVIEGVCEELQVPYFAARGYNSDSEQWRAAQRAKAHDAGGQTPRVLYLGDHDPSGLDMPRDLEQRFKLFGADVEVERLALNLGQISQYNLPPNPTKTTDRRAASYIAEFGHESWELDALEPHVISELVREAVLAFRDEAAWQAEFDREEVEKSQIHGLIDNLGAQA